MCKGKCHFTDCKYVKLVLQAYHPDYVADLESNCVSAISSCKLYPSIGSLGAFVWFHVSKFHWPFIIELLQDNNSNNITLKMAAMALTHPIPP